MEYSLGEISVFYFQFWKAENVEKLKALISAWVTCYIIYYFLAEEVEVLSFKGCESHFFLLILAEFNSFKFLRCQTFSLLFSTHIGGFTLILCYCSAFKRNLCLFLSDLSHICLLHIYTLPLCTFAICVINVQNTISVI